MCYLRSAHIQIDIVAKVTKQCHWFGHVGVWGVQGNKHGKVKCENYVGTTIH